MKIRVFSRNKRISCDSSKLQLQLRIPSCSVLFGTFLSGVCDGELGQKESWQAIGVDEQRAVLPPAITTQVALECLVQAVHASDR